MLSPFQRCKTAELSEVYEYKPNGQGKWKGGAQLPPELGKSSISNHCVVRY